MRAATLALVAIALASPASAQPAFLEIVHTYAQGSTDEAVGRLMRWSDAELAKAVKEFRSQILSSQPDLQTVEAAVMSITDLALAERVDNRPPEVTEHQIHLAHELIGLGAFRTAAGRPFAQRWYQLVVSLFISQWQPNLARDYIRLGLYFSDDKVLLLDTALISLMEVRAADADPRGGHDVDIESGLPNSSSKRSARDRAEREGRLRTAENACRRAIQIDPSYLDAHLRLGWVLMLSDVRGKARDEFILVRQRATRDDDRYLATMFLGALAASDHRLDEAARDYEDALAIGPGFQSAIAALSETELALGHADRARELSRRLGNHHGDAPKDPWWDFYLGAVDEDALMRLHNEAQRP